MRIAWLSPTAGNSGIVEYTRQIVPELTRHAQVDVWTHGSPRRPPAGAGLVDYAGATERLEELDGYDVVVYNIGNHLAFHRHELETARRIPGVVILHDRTLHHLWAGFYITHLQRADLYAERMRVLYGSRGEEVAAEVIAERGERAWATPEEVIDHSFIADTLSGALGAVVHSHGHADLVRAAWTGPVCDLPFPAYPSQLVRTPAPPSDHGEPLMLLSVGHVDRHKQIHATIEVLANDAELAQRVRYVVLGAYDPRAAYVRDLHRAIADTGLATRVVLLGYQPPGALARYLDRADVFINLRLPNLEGGSASLTEQLARGRPTVVYDTGSFAELPDDAVVKVPSDDRDGLAAALRSLTSDAELRERIGAGARRNAEARQISAYAEALAAFAQRARRWRTTRMLSARTGVALAWLGRDDAADIARVATEIDRLLSP